MRSASGASRLARVGSAVTGGASGDGRRRDGDRETEGEGEGEQKAMRRRYASRLGARAQRRDSVRRTLTHAQKTADTVAQHASTPPAVQG